MTRPIITETMIEERERERFEREAVLFSPLLIFGQAKALGVE
jgi:hypothetical protein